ncbi:MAG: phage tail tape measure protein [Phaeospirillum sp.]|nr:phage tail tape measure protein [Phaeospirillum sp.]
MRTLGVSVLIGAALAGGYRSTIGRAMQGIGELDKGMSGLQRRVMDVGQAWAGLYGISKITAAAGDLQHQLMEIGITADMTDSEIEKLRQHLHHLSVAGETNQSVNDLAKAYKALVSAGLNNGQATEALRSIGRAATASGADIEDLAKMSYTLIDTLGISPDGLSKEIDRLTFAGKKGSFELKDMARYLPTLGAAAKEAGLTGSEGVATLGASLQIARKGAGESSEAANNMKNFFQKMMSPETIKNMAKHGVNVTKMMADAMKKGENPVEVYLAKLDSMLGSDQVKRKARLGELFGDMQVQDFIRPMLSRMDQYKEDKAEILKATGTIDADYGRIMTTFNERSKAAANAVDKLGESVGRSLLPPLGAAMVLAAPVIEWMANLSGSAPGTTMAITGIGAALMVLPPALRLVAFGFRGLGIAMAANPIGLAVSGIALAAGVIYDNWVPIKFLFDNFWTLAQFRFEEFTAFLGSMWDPIKPKWDAFFSFIGDAWAMWSTPLRIMMAAGEIVGNAVSGKEVSIAPIGAALNKSAEAGTRMLGRVGLDGGNSAAQAAAGGGRLLGERVPIQRRVHRANPSWWWWGRRTCRGRPCPRIP